MTMASRDLRLKTVGKPEVRGSYARVPLIGGAITIIDAADLLLLEGRRWSVSGRYARSTSRPPVFLHRLIIDAPDGWEVDHIDGEGLNNRRENLRLATRQENSCNRSPIKDGHLTSDFKGVSWSASHRKWLARIKSNGQVYDLGYFVDEDKAALAYDAAAIRLFGAFAKTNAALGLFRTAQRGKRKHPLALRQF